MGEQIAARVSIARVAVEHRISSGQHLSLAAGVDAEHRRPALAPLGQRAVVVVEILVAPVGLGVPEQVEGFSMGEDRSFRAGVGREAGGSEGL